jgi:hypothetical protein
MHLKTNSLEIVIGKNNIIPKNPRYIIVGDNPGKKEKDKDKFFVGSAGIALENFLCKENIVNDFNNECFLFNKTTIHTGRTIDLKALNGEEQKYFQNNQIQNATDIANCANKNKLPVIILGLSNLEPNKLFSYFWNTLIEKTKDKNKVYVLCHPSFGNLSRQYKAHNDSKTKGESKIFHIGKEGYNRIMNEYKISTLR